MIYFHVRITSAIRCLFFFSVAVCSLNCLHCGRLFSCSMHSHTHCGTHWRNPPVHKFVQPAQRAPVKWAASRIHLTINYLECSSGCTRGGLHEKKQVDRGENKRTRTNKKNKHTHTCDVGRGKSYARGSNSRKVARPCVVWMAIWYYIKGIGTAITRHFHIRHAGSV